MIIPAKYPNIILASQSPYRRQLLENFGIKFQTLSPKVNESSLKVRGPKDLLELTRFLAIEKAKSLVAENSSCLIIGSDQIVDLEGERLDKPGNFENAVAQLSKMQGKQHRLITSVALVFKGQTLVHTDVTKISLRDLTPAELEAYVKLDQAFDCAGSYKIEKAGLGLIKELTTGDPSAIQGLPLIGLTSLFREIGLPVPQLWSLKT